MITITFMTENEKGKFKKENSNSDYVVVMKTKDEMIFDDMKGITLKVLEDKEKLKEFMDKI